MIEVGAIRILGETAHRVVMMTGDMDGVIGTSSVVNVANVANVANVVNVVNAAVVVDVTAVTVIAIAMEVLVAAPERGRSQRLRPSTRSANPPPT
jgi:hypothetical protein